MAVSSDNSGIVSGRRRTDVLLAALAGIACFLIYAPSTSPNAVNIDVPPVDAWSSTNTGTGSMAMVPGPYPEQPDTGVLDRVRQIQLEDLTHAVDRLGVGFGDAIARAVPFGSVPYRLSLSAALLGAVSVSLLVAVMRRLDLSRTAATASALGFAFHYLAWSSAVTPSPRMAFVPLLLLSLVALLRWSERRTPVFLWVGCGLWVLCTATEPLLVCALPAVVWFVYTTIGGRSAPGPVPAVMMAGAVLLLGVALGASDLGVQTWPAAPDAIPPFDTAVEELGPLGLVLLCIGLFGLVVRPTPAGLLFSLSLLGSVAWLLGAAAVRGEQLLIALVFACPTIGSGMSWLARGRSTRAHTSAAVVVCFMFPLINVTAQVAAVRELREEHAGWWAHARALADVLPEDAVVATVVGADEPITRLWQFAATDGRPIIGLPLVARRVVQLGTTRRVFVFEPTRQVLELLGFRFATLGSARADISLASYLGQLPRGTFVAAAAGSNIAQTLRPQLLTAFRAIGGGRAPDTVGPFYGIIGRVGSVAVVEEASGGAVQIHVAAGDVVDRRGTLFPVTLDLESAPGGAGISVNGTPVLEDVTDMAVVLLGPGPVVRDRLTVFARDDELRVPLEMRGRVTARLVEWNRCAQVETDAWVDVSQVVASGNFGISFSDRPDDGSLALYLTADRRLLTVESETSWVLRATIDFEVFDRADPADTAALDHLLALDGLESRAELRRHRFVHLAHVDVGSAEPPLADLRLDGGPAFAIARRLGPVEAPAITICPRTASAS